MAQPGIANDTGLRMLNPFPVPIFPAKNGPAGQGLLRTCFAHVELSCRELVSLEWVEGLVPPEIRSPAGAFLNVLGLIQTQEHCSLDRRHQVGEHQWPGRP